MAGLVIREDQFDALQPLAEAAFVRRLATHLRKFHSAQEVRLIDGPILINDLPTKTLEELVSLGINRAKVYELTTEKSLGAFIILMFIIAPNFDDHPSIKIFLQSEVLTESQKTELLNQLPKETINEANNMYSPEAWK